MALVCMTDDTHCPQCGSIHFNYDDFEDMWICEKCYIFYSPVELGLVDVLTAGYLHIGKG